MPTKTHRIAWFVCNLGADDSLLCALDGGEEIPRDACPWHGHDGECTAEVAVVRNDGQQLAIEVRSRFQFTVTNVTSGPSVGSFGNTTPNPTSYQTSYGPGDQGTKRTCLLVSGELVEHRQSEWPILPELEAQKSCNTRPSFLRQLAPHLVLSI